MQRLSNYSQNIFTKTPQHVQALSADFLLNQDPKQKKRTKTVCTLGPKSDSPESVGKLIDEGMNVARLNFSHGDHEYHRRLMANVHEALKSRPNCSVSIMLDTKGPEIRTGNNENNQPIVLKSGQLLQITTDYTHLGTSKRIACSYTDLPKSTDIGKKILIADGSISTRVVKIDKDIVTVEVLNDGKIGSKKNMCLPGTVITLPTIGPADEKDIIDFGLKYKVDCIAVSFARYKKDLDNLRKLLIEKDPEHGPFVQLISKIQNHEGIHNLEQIIDGSDGIMIARGDLGMEVPIEKVVILQKFITERTINAGKFVITATQMLESMQSKPRPTRAEVADITNAVYDLTDANMTSGQTANGQFPVESARMLRVIAQETQACCDYKKTFQARKQLVKDEACVGVISLSFQLNCQFIFIRTDDIKLIHRLSTLRPRAYIIVFSDNSKVKGAVGADFGVYVYPTENIKQPETFFLNYGINTGIRILRIETENGRICGTKIHEKK